MSDSGTAWVHNRIQKDVAEGRCWLPCQNCNEPVEVWDGFIGCVTCQACRERQAEMSDLYSNRTGLSHG